LTKSQNTVFFSGCGGFTPFYIHMRLRKAQVALSIKLAAFQASGGADT
jgi:hypothetical protein